MARSIPIVKLHGVLVVSIQIELSDSLVVEMKENITNDVAKFDARGLVIEVSGVDVFDSYIARSVRDIAHIVEFMGVRTVLSGLDPGMAVALTEMGMLLDGVATALNLESALALIDSWGKADSVTVADLLDDVVSSADEEFGYV